MTGLLHIWPHLLNIRGQHPTLPTLLCDPAASHLPGLPPQVTKYQGTAVLQTTQVQLEHCFPGIQLSSLLTTSTPRFSLPPPSPLPLTYTHHPTAT